MFQNVHLWTSDGTFFDEIPLYSGTSIERSAKGQKKMFAIRFRYIEVLYHIFLCYLAEECCSLYQGLRYIEVR